MEQELCIQHFFNLLYQDDPKTSLQFRIPIYSDLLDKKSLGTERDGIKATFIYDGVFPTKFGQHKLVSGVDSDIDKKYAQEYDMIPSGAFEVMQFLGGPEVLMLPLIERIITDFHPHKEVMSISS